MSAKSTTIVNETAKRTLSDYPAFAEAAEKCEHLNERLDRSAAGIKAHRAALASASNRTADRAVALLDDPSSPMPQSLASQLVEMEQDHDAIGVARGTALRNLQELREQVSHEQWKIEKPSHDALMGTVTTKIGELLAAIEAEQEFIRDLAARGFVISNNHLPVALHQMGGPLRQVHKHLVSQQAPKG